MTPAFFAAIAVCAVVIVRIWITARTDKMLPEYPPRRYLDTGLGLIAVASLVRAAGAWIDATTHHPGLADLGWRLPVTAAGSCMILYLAAQRTRQLITTRRIAALVWPTLLVIGALVVLWSLSAFSQGNAADVLPADDVAPWPQRLYLVTFDLHLLTWTIPLALRNWKLASAGYNSRDNATAREKSTAIGQLGMAIAAGSGSAAVAITIIRALSVGNGSLSAETRLHSVGTILSYLAPVGAAVGIGFPAVANLLNSFQTASLLRQLDQVLHGKERAAEHHQPSRPPLGIRLQPYTFAIEHYRARIADKLRSVTFKDEAAFRIVTNADVEGALGISLSDSALWDPSSEESTHHRTADKLLPAVSSSAQALDQLLAIARSYRVAAALTKVET